MLVLPSVAATRNIKTGPLYLTGRRFWDGEASWRVQKQLLSDEHMHRASVCSKKKSKFISAQPEQTAKCEKLPQETFEKKTFIFDFEISFWIWIPSKPSSNLQFILSSHPRACTSTLILHYPFDGLRSDGKPFADDLTLGRTCYHAHTSRLSGGSSGMIE